MQISIPIPNVVGFFKSHTKLTHTLAVIGTTAVTAFYQVPQFHTLVMNGYAKTPGSVKEIIATAVAVYAFYKSQKPQETQNPQ